MIVAQEISQNEIVVGEYTETYQAVIKGDASVGLCKMALNSVLPSAPRNRDIRNVLPNLSTTMFFTSFTSVNRRWHSKHGSSVEIVANRPLGVSA